MIQEKDNVILNKNLGNPRLILPSDKERAAYFVDYLDDYDPRHNAIKSIIEAFDELKADKKKKTTPLSGFLDWTKY